jgi:polysaccharide biosynthesis protein VpsQ
MVLAIAFTAGFAAVVVTADRGALPDGIKRLYDWPGGDKVGHVALLAGLTFFGALAFRGRRVRLGTWAPQLASVVAAAGITLEEASQAFFPGRTLSVADLACSYVGIYLGARAAAALLARRAPIGAPRVT